MKAPEGCAEGAAAIKGWCVRKNKNETSVHQLRDEGGCRSWRSVDRLEDSGARGHRAVDMGGDSARSRSVRLVMLGLAAAVGVVCLGAVSHVSQNSKARSVSASQRIALLQSVSAQREHDFAKVQNTRSNAVEGPVRPTHQKQQAAPATPLLVVHAMPVAQPGAQAQVSSSAQSQVAPNVPALARAAAAVSKPVVILPPPPPPAVKLNQETQEHLEDEIRSLRKAQEQREIRFMKEAAVSTVNEIARDKQDEEQKAVRAHEEHVNAVALSKMHVSQRWTKKMATPSQPTSRDEVERVLQKAMRAQKKQPQQAGKGKTAKVMAAKAEVKHMEEKKLTPAQEETLKVKEAAEATLKTEEKDKENKMAAEIEAHQDHETSMIEDRGKTRVLKTRSTRSTAKAKPKTKLSVKARESLELQERVERLLKHTDKAVAKNEEETRVKHAEALLTEEVAAAKAKTEALARAKAAKALVKAAQQQVEKEKTMHQRAAAKKAAKQNSAAASKIVAERNARQQEIRAKKTALRQAAAQRKAAAEKAGARTGAGVTTASLRKKQQIDTQTHTQRHTQPQKKAAVREGKEAHVNGVASEREEEVVEEKKREAEAKRAALQRKIAELHKMLTHESAEADALQKHGLHAAVHTQSAAEAAAEARGKGGSAALLKGGVAAATAQHVGENTVAWKPAAKVMAPEDHTSAQALKQGLLVAENVMQRMDQRKEARIEARNPRLLRKKAATLAAEHELDGSRATIAAALEEHAAGLNLSPGQAGEEEFGAFA